MKYSRTDIKIGRGRHHAVELIIYKNDLYALKKIPKITIDKQKRIDHLKNEKKICHLLQEKVSVPEYFIKLEETFMDKESINFIFEFMPGQDLYQAIQNELNRKIAISGKSSKDWTKFYAAEVLCALEMLHE